jgi:glutamate synthase (NADPH/NADH) large chain
VRLKDLPEREHIVHPIASITRRQRTFGYTEEEVRILLTPMGQNGAEPLGAMGSDTPDRGAQRAPAPAVRLLRAAVRAGDQPAAGLDPRRGRHLARPRARPERNLLDWGPEHTRTITLDFPVIDNDELAKLQNIDKALPGVAR